MKSNKKSIKSISVTLLLSVIVNSIFVNGFYVPGTAPQDFAKGDIVEVKVSFFRQALIKHFLDSLNLNYSYLLISKAVKLLSTKTQLPYEYYSIPIHCKPSEGVEYKSENLGEILRGDRVVNTAYNLKMNVNEQCRVVCSDVVLDKKGADTIAHRIMVSLKEFLISSIKKGCQF